MIPLCWMLFTAMNVFTFSLYGADKRRACQGARRIPERTLLLATWMMGGVGAYGGMRVFHHKTRHAVFAVSAPVAAAASLAVMSLATAALSG